jgi:para-aminobenzoate synthetase component 1
VRPPGTAASALLAHLPDDVAVAAWRRGDRVVVGLGAAETVAASGADALGALDRLAPGLWVGFLAYELGHAIERVATGVAGRAPREVPDLVLVRFDARAQVDRGGGVTIEGDGEARRLLEDAARVTREGTGAAADARERATGIRATRDDDIADGWRSSLARDAYEARVRAVLEMLHAGECYQVNLTRRVTREGALDPVALFGALTRAHPSPHAALLRVALDGRPVAVVSASPERFLRWRGRRVETRPVKGTARDATALRASAKDRAENVMIVDLARNDLGRVCEFGSVHVPSLCGIEAHPGLVHLVSTVRGTLRGDVGPGALVRATFPPASVTGAPKPRVLQAIEELEPVRRGVYCGALGWIDTERDEGDLAVAIRTFTILGTPDDPGGTTQLGVGGGVVADSTPAGEWAETELKAARLLQIAGAVGAPRELVAS